MRCLVVIVLAFALAGCEQDGDSILDLATPPPPPEPVSEAEQRTLPSVQYVLGELLCPGIYPPGQRAKIKADAEAELDALISALHRHPDAGVEAQFTLADPEAGEERVQTQVIPITELARGQLTNLRGQGPCPTGYRLQLQAALRAAERD